jgi:sterol desaturase/sphingolipid hydroxylase (fatty acid hydroxylase superfamily)
MFCEKQRLQNSCSVKREGEMLEFLQDLLHVRDAEQMNILIALIGVDFGLTLLLGKKHFFQASDSFVSIGLGVIYAFSLLAFAGVVLVGYSFVYQYRVIDFNWHGSVLALLAAYVLVDFAFYWYHRATHMIRFGWAAHVTHHSSQYFNVGTALRASFADAPMEPLFIFPLALIGIDPVLLVGAVSLNHLYQYGLHTRHVPKLGQLEWVFNTPSHHRVHHGCNIQYCDKNFGGTFIIFDRLFGTFEEENETVVFGILKPLDSRNLLWVIFHEWVAIARDLRKARTFSDAMGCLFGPPGWAPDGKSETTAMLQAQLKLQQMAELPQMSR